MNYTFLGLGIHIHILPILIDKQYRHVLRIRILSEGRGRITCDGLQDVHVCVKQNRNMAWSPLESILTLIVAGLTNFFSYSGSASTPSGNGPRGSDIV